MHVRFFLLTFFVFGVGFDTLCMNSTAIYNSHAITTTAKIHEKMTKVYLMSESQKEIPILKNTYDGLLALLPFLQDGSYKGSYKRLLMESAFNQRINILLASNCIGFSEISAYAIKRLQVILFNHANVVTLFNQPKLLEEYKNQGLGDNFRQQLGFYKNLEDDLRALNPSPEELRAIELLLKDKTNFKLEHAILLKGIILSNKKLEKLNLLDSKYAHMLKSFETLPQNLKPLFAKHLYFYDWSNSTYPEVIDFLTQAYCYNVKDSQIK